MRRAAIDDQEYWVRGSNHQTFEKLDEDIGVDAAFFLDHETHVTARRDRRDQAHAVAGSGCLDDWRFASSAPSPAGVMIRADMRSSPSRRPSRRADTAPTIHIPSTGSARERGRRPPGFRLPGPYAPRVHATLPAYDDPIGAHHFLT